MFYNGGYLTKNIYAHLLYGSGHETVAVLLPGFAINWYQNQVTR